MALPKLLRRIFVVSIALCVLIPISWLLLSHNTTERPIDFHYAQYPIKLWRNVEKVTHNNLAKRRTGVKPVHSGVLVVYRYRSNPTFRGVRLLLQAHRIDHDIYLMSTTRHMPELVQTSTTNKQPVGHYSIIIVVDIIGFIQEESIHELFIEYCRGFDATLILIPSEKDKLKLTNSPDLFENDVNLFTLPQSLSIHYLQVHEADDFVYARDGGMWTWHSNTTKIVSFWPHKKSASGNTLTLNPYEPDMIIKRFQPLASVYYSRSTNKELQSLPVGLIDWSSSDDIRRVFIGIPMSLAITKLLLLETLRIFSSEHNIMRFGVKRWIQVDIDDVFVAPLGHKTTAEDIEVGPLC